ncbi:hypothetical protein HPB48_015546 [Haemaphysalis longicornis]|uniref:Uncharacterized protein n=1 Tax=Haemaphysalis longicornis TaxID=44386 RepID=A0A9J6FKM3_HAELO|nr:hypothetical protein HPB48_015546 [Haemaphysalis longicornis]
MKPLAPTLERPCKKLKRSRPPAPPALAEETTRVAGKRRRGAIVGRQGRRPAVGDRKHYRNRVNCRKVLTHAGKRPKNGKYAASPSRPRSDAAAATRRRAATTRKIGGENVPRIYYAGKQTCTT